MPHEITSSTTTEGFYEQIPTESATESQTGETEATVKTEAFGNMDKVNTSEKGLEKATNEKSSKLEETSKNKTKGEEVAITEKKSVPQKHCNKCSFMVEGTEFSFKNSIGAYFKIDFLELFHKCLSFRTLLPLFRSAGGKVTAFLSGQTDIDSHRKIHQRFTFQVNLNK